MTIVAFYNDLVVHMTEAYTIPEAVRRMDRPNHASPLVVYWPHRAGMSGAAGAAALAGMLRPTWQHEAVSTPPRRRLGFAPLLCALGATFEARPRSTASERPQWHRVKPR